MKGMEIICVNLIQRLRRLLARRSEEYVVPQKYWNRRWKLKVDPDATQIEVKTSLRNIRTVMTRFKCGNILEVGCGRGELRNLPGYLGLDFSLPVLKRSGLQNFMYADITKSIPLPDKVFDAVLSRYVLLHIPFDRIDLAVGEMSRVAKKCVILYETWSTRQEQVGNYCFLHDLPRLFKRHFDGAVVLVRKEKGKETITGCSKSLAAGASDQSQ